MRGPTFVSAFIFVTALPAASAAPQSSDATLERVLQRAAQYVVDYAKSMSFVVSTENYGQWMEIPNALRPMHRMLVSEYAIVRIGDDWEAFRDVYEVEGRPVGERQDRLKRLFLESPATAVKQARQLADESARYNLGNIRRNFNTPTMALFFLQGNNQSRFKWKKAGEDRIDGIGVWKLRYEEIQKPTLIRTSAGKDMAVGGTLWIESAGGRVLKTHMEIRTEAHLSGTGTEHIMQEPSARYPSRPPTRVNSTASITVTYKQDSRLGILVPAEMLETYEGPWKDTLSALEGTTRINCRATYSDFKRFDVGTTWTVPRN